MSLLSDIENAAADSSTPIGDLLRKCKVLAVRLQDAKFAAWVHYELNGYPRDQETELPSYRKTKLPIAMGHFAGPFGSGLKNAPIPIGLLPTELAANFENILLVEPVAELETFATAIEPLKRKWPGDVIAYVAHHHEIYEGMNLVDAWNPMSPAMFRGVIDAVRSRVLDFALAIERANPNAGDVAPNAPAPVAPQTVSNIFHTTIYGGNSNVGTTGSARIDNSDPTTTITLADNKAHELAGLERIP